MRGDEAMLVKAITLTMRFLKRLNVKKIYFTNHFYNSIETIKNTV